MLGGGSGESGIGRAAVLISAITMLARVIGFGRQVVFAHTVQAQCLGTAYTTANMVPNIIYDIVMGGALTAVVVPVLAGPARARAADPEQAERTSAALLSWTVLLLVPVSAVVAIAARPLVSVLLGAAPGCPRPAMVALGTRMLIVFAPAEHFRHPGQRRRLGTGQGGHRRAQLGLGQVGTASDQQLLHHHLAAGPDGPAQSLRGGADLLVVDAHRTVDRVLGGQQDGGVGSDS